MSAPVANPPKSQAAAAREQQAPVPATPSQPTAPAASALLGFSGNRRVPKPVNETVRTYAPGSPERTELKARLAKMASERIEIPIIIGGKEIRTGDLGRSVMPHAHSHVLAEYHKATPKHAEMEIDAACELIDFWRFNAHFAQELYDEQPISDKGMWNQLDYRALEGFVYAVTPFNFTAIAGNLPTSAALLGNTVIWKPASSAMLSAYHIMKLLEEAGLPPGVINFLPGDPAPITDAVLASPELAGVHFTGSTSVFNSIWRTIGQNIGSYKSYPRIVGETGGKDFIVAHPSADARALSVAIARGAYEYQGQKCSAASRIYVPESLWPEVRDRTVAMMREIRVGDVRDFRNFMGAVIDQKAFTKIGEYLDDAKRNATVVQGGVTRGEDGY